MAGTDSAGIEAKMIETSQWKDADRREHPRSSLRLKLVVLYPQIDRSTGQANVPWENQRHQHVGAVDGSQLQHISGRRSQGRSGSAAGACRGPRKVVTYTAEMTYAIHSSKLDAFKIGLAFRTFRGEGRALLKAALQHALKQESAEGTQEPGVLAPMRSSLWTATCAVGGEPAEGLKRWCAPVSNVSQSAGSLRRCLSSAISVSSSATRCSNCSMRRLRCSRPSRCRLRPAGFRCCRRRPARR